VPYIRPWNALRIASLQFSISRQVLDNGIKILHNRRLEKLGGQAKIFPEITHKDAAPFITDIVMKVGFNKYPVFQSIRGLRYYWVLGILLQLAKTWD